MNHITITLLSIVSLLGLTACDKPVEDTRPGQPVKTRQIAFKEILKVFEPMGTMLRTDRYEPLKFLVLANALQEKRDAPWTHFGTDTLYPPTKAKPEIWSEADQFERERKAFITATDELLAAAKTRQQINADKAYQKTYEICQSCHKHFKLK
jgi:cytochrome c556